MIDISGLDFSQEELCHECPKGFREVPKLNSMNRQWFVVRLSTSHGFTGDYMIPGVSEEAVRVDYNSHSPHLRIISIRPMEDPT